MNKLLEQGLRRLRGFEHDAPLQRLMARYPVLAEHYIELDRLFNPGLLKELSSEQSQRLKIIQDELLEAVEDKKRLLSRTAENSQHLARLIAEANKALREILPAKALVNLDGTLFRLPELEKLYKQYGRKRSRLEWAWNTDSKQAKKIFTRYLGDGWRDKLGRGPRLRDLSSFPALRREPTAKYEEFRSFVDGITRQHGKTADEVMIDILYGGVWEGKIPTRLPKSKDLEWLPVNTNSIISLPRLNPLIGNVGEALVLRKQINLLKHYGAFKAGDWKLKGVRFKDIEEIAYYPNLRADFDVYVPLDVDGNVMVKVEPRKAKKTTDGAIMVTLRGRPPRSIFVDINEVKGGLIGAKGAFDQFFERLEMHGPEGFTRFQLEHRKYVVNKDTGEVVEVLLEKPVSLLYDRGQSFTREEIAAVDGTVSGLYQAQKRIYAADDRLHIEREKWASGKSTGNYEKPEPIGLEREDIFHLAAYLYALG
ncbi:MAG: hypothetical protein R3293_25420, partial [Candidatus Promineifilaceae bacterium]|nr:hypothetical protein [Candidatus Promineifilaceae bacterium]